MKPKNVAIVGCGVIATPYANDMRAFDSLRLHGCFDLDAARAREYAEQHGCRAYDTLEALLADDEVDLVVNLTVLPAHYDVTKRALEAGRHVYSEKPLAQTAAQAQELVALARSRGVRLACAPATFLGEAQERARREIRAGRLGQVRAVYAEANHGRIEVWHGQPHSFYAVGPLRDVGVYPLGVVTSVFGPAERVWAYGRTLKPERVTKRGEPFTATAPDFYVVVVEFGEGGPVLRLTCSFYTTDQGQQKGVEFHGDDGQLFLSSWFAPGAAIEVAAYGQRYAPLEDFTPVSGLWNWAAGLDDLAHAIDEDRPHRVSGEQAAHIVELLEAAHRSIETGEAVRLTTRFTPHADLSAPTPA